MQKPIQKSKLYFGLVYRTIGPAPDQSTVLKQDPANRAIQIAATPAKEPGGRFMVETLEERAIIPVAGLGGLTKSCGRYGLA